MSDDDSGSKGWYSSYSSSSDSSLNNASDDASIESGSSSSSMTKRKQQRSSSRRTPELDSFLTSHGKQSNNRGGSSASSRNRTIATTLFCAAVGASLAFSQGTLTLWGGDGGSRSLRANSRLLQVVAQDLDTYTSSVGRNLDPDEIAKFLARYGLEVKDLELLGQLKGIKQPEASTSPLTTESGMNPSGGMMTTTQGEGQMPQMDTMQQQPSTTSTGTQQFGTQPSSSSQMGTTDTQQYGTQPSSQMGTQPQQQQQPMMQTQQQQGTTNGFLQQQEQPQQQQGGGQFQNGMMMQQQPQQGQPFVAQNQMQQPLSMVGQQQQGIVAASSPQMGFPQQASSAMASTGTGSTAEQQQQQMGTTFQQQEAAPADASTSTSTAGGESDLSALANFKDSWDPWEQSDVPIFFHIPKAGGSTVKDVIGTCHRFVMATEYGVTDGHDADTSIAIVYPAGGPPGTDRSPFVNVDTTTVAGIERANAMGFADAGLADAVVTPFIYEANDLFTPTARGRLFTVFRNPIERAISMFFYIQVADWEPTYSPDLKDWTIEQYAESDRIENNWMTRQLSQQLSGELTDENLKVAMDVIRSKFLVGLMNQMDRTMERFEKFFHWKFHVNPENQEKCRENLMHGGSNSNSKGPKKDKPKEGDSAWEKILWQNQYDMKLYEYIESLFEEQEAFVADIPDGFRGIDATCCKCSPATFPVEGFECPKSVLN